MVIDTGSVLHEYRVMKNVTITLPEEVARWARVQAALMDKSLSRMIADILKERMQEEQTYDSACRAFLSRKPSKLKRSGGYPSRDEVHER